MSNLLDKIKDWLSDISNPFRHLNWSWDKVQAWAREILSGNVFTQEAFKRQWALIALIAFWIFVYVACGFRMAGQQAQIKQLQRELREARFTMLELSADYVNMSKPSAIADKLESEDSKVKESSNPPIAVE